MDWRSFLAGTAVVGVLVLAVGMSRAPVPVSEVGRFELHEVDMPVTHFSKRVPSETKLERQIVLVDTVTGDIRIRNKSDGILPPLDQYIDLDRWFILRLEENTAGPSGYKDIGAMPDSYKKAEDTPEAILTPSSRDHHSTASPPLCKESS